MGRFIFIYVFLSTVLKTYKKKKVKVNDYFIDKKEVVLCLNNFLMPLAIFTFLLRSLSLIKNKLKVIMIIIFMYTSMMNLDLN